jgi:DNA polymerase I-like protein with 3'-5' exonuclease and polymerase domains
VSIAALDTQSSPQLGSTLIYDVETDGLLDTVKTVHCVVVKPFQRAVVGIYVSSENLERAKIWAKEKIKADRVFVGTFDHLIQIFSGQYRFVAHNQLGYDIHVLHRFFGISASLSQIVDTLVMSRFLFPDRPKGHSLEDWSKSDEISGEKKQIEDWEGDTIEAYLERCAADVLLNEQVYAYLRQELADPLLHEPFRLAQHTYWEMCLQEQTGVLFDQTAGRKLLTEIDQKMKAIAAEVEPEFGEAPLPKSKQPTFPKKPFKKDDSLSASAINYGRKLGITDSGELMAEIRMAQKNGPRVFKAPITLDNMGHVKKYLFDNGWVPTMWRTNDITLDSNKKRETPTKKRTRAIKYVREMWASPYRKVVWSRLEIPKDLHVPKLDEVQFGRAVNIVMRKGKGLPMSPQVANQFKVMCPNLEKLQGNIAKKILKWMSMKNRRGVLASWLVHPRLKQDGRLPAASSGWTNTFRERHAVVVNLPSADGKTVYGVEMRGLFVALDGWTLLGYDASGLEARIAGHLAAEFDDGAYAHEVLEGDIHAKNAIAYSRATGREVSRKEGKPGTYAILYGAGKHKIATMFDVLPDVGQKMIDMFWDTNLGLKMVVEKLTEEWQATGREFVRTVDGRKIWIRSKHSILNAVIQSTGSMIMNRSWKIFCNRAGTRRQTHWRRIAFFHDEFLLEVLSGYGDELGQQAIQSIASAGEFYDFRVPLTGDYKLGDSYDKVH